MGLRSLCALGVASLTACGLFSDLDGYAGGPPDGAAGDAANVDATDPQPDGTAPPPDAGEQDAGVVVRGVVAKQSDGTLKVTFAEPATTRTGDVTLVFFLRTADPAYLPLTVPAGFDQIKTNTYVCNYRKSTFDAYIRPVTGPGPSVLDFTVGSNSAISATLVTLGGLSSALEATVLATLSGKGAGPYSLTTLNGGSKPAYGLSVYTGGAGGTPVGLVTFTVPAGKTKLSDQNSIAVFGEDVPAAGTLSNANTILMSSSSCGFGFAALLNRP